MKTIQPILIIISFILSLSFLSAQNESFRKSHYNLKKGLAIQGYDPVAYFTKGKAIKGNPERKHTLNGVTYYFASDATKRSFISKPSKYEPQYGGWCAYALAKDAGKVKINPKRFKIIDEKLYLFYDSVAWGNTLKDWNKGNDQKQLTKANTAWAKATK